MVDISTTYYNTVDFEFGLGQSQGLIRVNKDRIIITKISKRKKIHAIQAIKSPILPHKQVGSG